MDLLMSWRYNHWFYSISQGVGLGGCVKMIPLFYFFPFLSFLKDKVSHLSSRLTDTLFLSVFAALPLEMSQGAAVPPDSHVQCSPAPP